MPRTSYVPWMWLTYRPPPGLLYSPCSITGISFRLQSNVNQDITCLHQSRVVTRPLTFPPHPKHIPFTPKCDLGPLGSPPYACSSVKPSLSHWIHYLRNNDLWVHCFLPLDDMLLPCRMARWVDSIITTDTPTAALSVVTK